MISSTSTVNSLLQAPLSTCTYIYYFRNILVGTNLGRSMVMSCYWHHGNMSLIRAHHADCYSTDRVSRVDIEEI